MGNHKAAVVEVGNPEAAAVVVGNPEAAVVVVGNHGVAVLVDKPGAVQVDIPLKGEQADLTETFVEQVALPLAVVQIFHLFCPFQPCAVSE